MKKLFKAYGIWMTPIKALVICTPFVVLIIWEIKWWINHIKAL